MTRKTITVRRCSKTSQRPNQKEPMRPSGTPPRTKLKIWKTNQTKELLSTLITKSARAGMPPIRERGTEKTNKSRYSRKESQVQIKSSTGR